MRALGILVIVTLLTSLVSVSPAMSAAPAHAAFAVTSAAGTPAATGPCGAPSGTALIVYQELTFSPATPGAVAGATLVTTTPDGRVVHRTAVPGFAQLDPLGVGCATLVDVAGHGTSLLDPGTGSVMQIALAGKTFDQLMPAPWWQRTARETRWALLSDDTGQAALLLDTRTGQLTDLAAVVQALRGQPVGGPPVPLGAQISADGAHLLLATDRDAWVMPTTDPRRGRRLADATPAPASFAEDGRQILYVRTAGQNQSRIVVQDVNGSGSTDVATGDGNTFAYWIPGSKSSQILLLRLRSGRVSVVRLPDKQERDLLTLPPATPAQPIFSPSGRQLLIRAVTSDQAPTWVWIDLATGQHHQLDALTGYRLYSPVAPGVRWLELASFDISGTAKPGADIRGLDLDTGTIRRLLVFDGGEPYAGLGPTTHIISGDGRFAVVNDFGANYPGFWLLDAAQGTSQRFSGRLCSAISPDGGTILVSAPVGTSKPPQWRILLMTARGGDERTLAESSAPGGVWVPLPWSNRS